MTIQSVEVEITWLQHDIATVADPNIKARLEKRLERLQKWLQRQAVTHE